MQQVKNIKELMDAAKPFMAAIPEGHPMAKLVATYVDAERVAAGTLEHNDAMYFDSVASAAIVYGEVLVEYYVRLSGLCETIPAKTVDAWDGCENG